jgi:hypothetical protein
MMGIGLFEMLILGGVVLLGLAVVAGIVIAISRGSGGGQRRGD